LYAHLSRIPLSPNTLHPDRLYIIKKCPFLVQEMVTCISQLILLAHAGRIGRLPSLDTIENAMKLSPLVVQALWDKSSPLLQLPHIQDDMLKYFHSRRRNIKTLQQLAKMKDEDRRSLLRQLSDEQYKDVIRVLAMMPVLDVTITTEVVDDEEQHVVTAGAIVTVTIVLIRNTMESLANLPLDLNDDDDEEREEKENEDLDSDMVEVTHEDGENVDETEDADKKKGPVWRKPQKKKGGKKGTTGGKQKTKSTKNKKDVKAAGDNVAPTDAQGTTNQNHNKASDNSDGHGTITQKAKSLRKDNKDENDSDAEESSASGNESDDNANKAQSTVDEEDDEAEWERFQRKLNKREKALEGKSRVSHSVHCPYFTDDKQEFWWCYISDRKSHALVTPPSFLTSLVEREEVELKFTAPPKPGHYTFTVNVKSDSYLGVDVSQDIKLDVHEAREAPSEHPQWEFEDEDEDENSKGEESDDEFATDDDFEDDD